VIGVLSATASHAQFIDFESSRDTSAVDVRPSIYLAAALSSLNVPRPNITLEGQLARFEVPVFHSSKFGVSVRGSVSMPGIPVEGDTVPEGLRGFFGGGSGWSIAAHPYLKLRYLQGLIGYIYLRYEQQLWTGTTETTQDLYASRISLPGILFMADLNDMFGLDPSHEGPRASLFFDVALEQVRFQSFDGFSQIMPDLDEEIERYRRIRFGLGLNSTRFYAEHVSNGSLSLWSAGVVVTLIQ
jgi:hypothetical protein